jgi:hypothetical protein
MQKLIPALIKFQETVPLIPKNSVNPYFSQGERKAMYADLPTVIDVCKPVLNANGLAITQLAQTESGKNILKTVLYHTSGEFIESSIYLPDITDPQKLTAAITYLRRTAYLSICGLVGDTDDDGNSVGDAPNKPQNQSQSTQQRGQPPSQGDGPKPSAKQLSYIKMLADKAGVPMPTILTIADADKAIKELTKASRS